MGAAADLAGSVKTGDGIEVLVDDLSLEVGDETTHGVVNLGPELRHVERRRFNGGSVLENKGVEVIVFPVAHEAVPAGHFGLEFVGGNRELCRDVVERVESHDDAGAQAAFQNTRGLPAPPRRGHRP